MGHDAGDTSGEVNPVTETLGYAVSSIAPVDSYIVDVTATTLATLTNRARSTWRLPEGHLKAFLGPLIASARRVTVVEGES